ncbi:MAG: hypothetical protein IPP47_22765 [Bryobacterales bacterium]|nr:hypothetical protein [Bryobacterales bacterium]
MIGRTSGCPWYFDTAAGSVTVGLVTVYQDRNIDWSVVSQTDYGWGLNGGNPYVGWTQTTRNGVASKVAQTLDGYGNVTSKTVYNTDLVLANARVYNYTYLTGGYYTDRYIRNRVTSATFTAGGQTVTLGTNVYDNNSYAGTWLTDTWVPDPYGVRLHDATYDANFTFRGNVTQSTTLSNPVAKNLFYDLGGNVVKTTGGGGPQVDATLTAATNYMVPSTVTPNSEANLASSAQWDSLLRLTSATGPNGATMTVAGYDAASRPGTTTSATGVVTSFTYSNSAPQVRATVNGRWTRTSYDGLGRTVKVESGTGDTVVSIVETVYGPCACTPLGKVQKVSRPYAPGGTVYWTEYTYDALGRTLSVIQPGNSGTTTYAYTGNTVTVTDPGGKWKTMTVDGFGNLVTVVEPNPAGGTNFTTSYVYNSFNQLTTVTMPRPTGTQTRTFVYNAAGQMTSVTQPETGTTTFGYDASGRPAWKRDAKQQLTEFSYDAYNRTTQILRYKRVAGADVLDPAQKTVYSYDSAVNGWGRLGSISTYQHFGDLTGATPIVESFEYTVAGLVSKKTLNVTGVFGPVDVTYGWDNEGRPVAEVPGGRAAVYVGL